MTALEQAARALLASESNGEQAWDDLDMVTRGAFLRDARAVLKAIREPSDEVTDAGVAMLTERGCNPLSGDAEAVWQAMIDAALTE